MIETAKFGSWMEILPSGRTGDKTLDSVGGLMVMNASARERFQSGLAEIAEEIDSWELAGVKCEVRGCLRESEEFWEQGEDEGRNLCTIHWRMLEGWRRSGPLTSGLRLRVPFDDGSEIVLRHETRELG